MSVCKLLQGGGRLIYMTSLVAMLVGLAGGVRAQSGSTQPARVDKATREVAIQRILADRARDVSPLARAMAATHRSLTISERLADEASKDLQAGVRPEDSEALKRLVLAVHDFRAAYETLQSSLTKRPAATRRQVTTVTRARRDRTVARSRARQHTSRLTATGSQAFRRVRRVLELQEQLRRSVAAGDRRSVNRALRGIRRGAEQALLAIRRAPARLSGVVHVPLPENRRDLSSTDSASESMPRTVRR